MSDATRLGRPRAASIAVALVLSWLGLYLHNLWELALPLSRPENSVTLLVAAGLAVAWWRKAKSMDRGTADGFGRAQRPRPAFLREGS